MSEQELRLGLDIRNWIPKPGETPKQTKRRAARDLTYALTEQEKAPAEERNNPGEFLIDRKQKLLLDPDTGIPIIKLLRQKTRSDSLENYAFSEVQKWVFKDKAEDDDKKYLLWTSPPSKEFGYTEARFMVFRIGEEEGQEFLYFDAGCGTQGPEECLEIANRLLSMFPEPFLIQNDNELRIHPIPFNPPAGMHWTDFLASFITPAARWEIIKRGEHRQKKQERRIIAEKIVSRHFNQIQGCSQYGLLKHILIGAQMEEEARRYYDITFQANGSHGSSNTEVLNKLDAGIFNSMYSQASGQADSEKNSLCRKCHKEPAGTGGTCSKCK